MKDFFIDTANIDYIEKLWETIKHKIDCKSVRGITTNPNAYFKINKLLLSEWLEHQIKLCELITKIRGDNKGVVYIQCPYSQMSSDEVLKFAKLVSQNNDGNTKIGLKIPPYKHILEIHQQLNEIMEVNVTGISDCATALKCISYGVKYVSIIPGRMEEVGIDAKQQIEFINQSKMNSEIITGSMRTIDGLKWVFQYGTIPTIGERVWDLLLVDNKLNEIINLHDISIPKYNEFSPEIDNRNYDLSSSFFKQMDKCGENAYNDFNNMI